jgi:hypothetical protein
MHKIHIFGKLNRYRYITKKEELTGFSLGSLVVGGGNLTRGPSTSSVEGKLNSLFAMA